MATQYDAIIIGTGQAGGTGPDHAHLLAGVNHMRQVGTPSFGEGGIDNMPFDGADGDRAVSSIQGAGALAQAILRTDAATNFRQAVGLVGQLGSFDDAALGGQFQPVRYVVVDRAIPAPRQWSKVSATMVVNT